MKQVNPFEQTPAFLQQMSRKGGAFLTVKDAQGRVNTMTIGWGFVGHAWGQDVLTVMVREARHTYGLIENAQCFTVSAPVGVDMAGALALCGTKSGRDMDKFAAAGLTQAPGQAVDCPVVGECTLHFECEIVMRQAMQPGLLTEALDTKMYAAQDYHTLYTGRIKACYRTD